MLMYIHLVARIISTVVSHTLPHRNLVEAVKKNDNKNTPTKFRRGFGRERVLGGIKSRSVERRASSFLQLKMQTTSEPSTIWSISRKTQRNEGLTRVFSRATRYAKNPILHTAHFDARVPSQEIQPVTRASREQQVVKNSPHSWENHLFCTENTTSNHSSQKENIM